MNSLFQVRPKWILQEGHISNCQVKLNLSLNYKWHLQPHNLTIWVFTLVQQPQGDRKLKLVTINIENLWVQANCRFKENNSIQVVELKPRRMLYSLNAEFKHQACSVTSTQTLVVLPTSNNQVSTNGSRVLPSIMLQQTPNQINLSTKTPRQIISSSPYYTETNFSRRNNWLWLEEWFCKRLGLYLLIRHHLKLWGMEVILRVSYLNKHWKKWRSSHCKYNSRKAKLSILHNRNRSILRFLKIKMMPEER